MVLGGGPPGRLAAAATSPPNCKSPRKDLRVIDLWDFSAELPSARQRNLRGPPTSRDGQWFPIASASSSPSSKSAAGGQGVHVWPRDQEAAPTPSNREEVAT